MEADMAIRWVRRYVDSAYRRFLVDSTTGEILDADYAVKFRDDWIGKALNATDTWTSTATTGTNAHAAGPILKMTTHTGARDSNTVCSGLTILPTHSPIVQASVALTHAVNPMVAGYFFGFSDAVTESETYLPIDATGAVIRATATDAVGFVMDNAYTGHTAELIFCSVNAGGTAQAINTGIVVVASTYNVLRVELDGSANARGYVDGTYIGTLSAAVASPPGTGGLCIALGGITNTTAAKAIDWKSVQLWCDTA
jgi:hypothetical protein